MNNTLGYILDKFNIETGKDMPRFLISTPTMGGSSEDISDTLNVATPPEAASKYELGPYVAGLQVTDLTTQGMAINETHVFRANLINEFRVTYGNRVNHAHSKGLGENWPSKLGIKGVPDDAELGQ